MSRFFDLVSKPARDMGGYAPQPARQPRTPRRFIHLDSNENPFGPSPRAVEAMRSGLATVHAYPDDNCTELRSKLAGYHDVPMDQILVTAGSTSLLGLLCQTFLGPGLNAITSERSFIVYSMVVRSVGAQLIEAPMRQDTFDPDAVLHAINENTRLIFLANPNNPTGTMLNAGAVSDFLGRVPAHVVVVLDEAYHDFAVQIAALRKVAYPNSVEHVRRGASIVMLRTFSKAHGLAGLRVGYGLGPAELLSYCARMQNTFSVASVAQSAALAAMDDRSHIDRVTASNAAEGRILSTSLTEMGFRVAPTFANFVYCDVGEDSFDFAQRILDEGVSVRPLGPWGAPTCIRVSIGTSDENRFFLDAVQKIGVAQRNITARR